MQREKQIEEMAKIMARRSVAFRNPNVAFMTTAGKTAESLYNAGYRKQKEAKWKDNHCTNCGMTPLGEEMWTRLDLTPPRFEWFMNFCPECGAKMKGGEE